MQIKSYYSVSCHFEAVGREIPRAQQVKATWLDKIYGQSPPFTSYLWDKTKVGGFLPAVEMTCLSSAIMLNRVVPE